MATCKYCVHYEVCKRIDYELEYHNKSIKEAEEELPIKCRFFKNKADVVPVVMCKDCKRCYEKRTKLNNQIMRFCMRMDGNEYQVNANDFCSYGTPKERGGEK